MDSLKYTSAIALFSVAYLVVLVVYHYASGDTIDKKGEIHWIKSQGILPVLSSFPVMVFAYTCHQNVRYYRHCKSSLADEGVDVLHLERDPG